MDANQFDTLTRSVPTSSRRQTVRLLLGSLLGGLLPLGSEPAGAKKKGDKNRKRHDKGPNR